MSKAGRESLYTAMPRQEMNFNNILKMSELTNRQNSWHRHICFLLKLAVLTSILLMCLFTSAFAEKTKLQGIDQSPPLRIVFLLDISLSMSDKNRSDLWIPTMRYLIDFIKLSYWQQHRRHPLAVIPEVLIGNTVFL